MLGVRLLRSVGQRLNEQSIYSGFSEQHQHCHLRFCRRLSYLRGALRRHSQMLGGQQVRSTGQRLNNERSNNSGFSEQHQHCHLRFCRTWSYLRVALRRHSQMLGGRQLRSTGQRLNEQSNYSGWSTGVLIRSVRRNDGSNNTKAFWPHWLG